MKPVIPLLIMTVSLAACSKTVPCDPEKIEAFFQLPADKALGGARFLCEYPRGLKKMLDSVDMASPEQRLQMVARAVSEDISHLELVCHRAVGVFREMAEVAPDRKVPLLIEGCHLTSLGLASRAEMLKADLSKLMVAVMLYGWMQEKKVPQARRICRFILAMD
jgi:hypothetical protein